MKHHVLVSFLALTAGVLTSCAVDQLVTRHPKLRICTVGADSVCNEDASQILTVDLGEVAVYSRGIARVELNNFGEQVLQVRELNYTVKNPQAGWEPAVVVRPPGEPQNVPVNGSRFLDIPYRPAAEGAAAADLEIVTNAGNGNPWIVRVLATGVFRGAPDIEVRYYADNPSNPTGPDTATDCVDEDLDGVADRCIMSQPFNVGGVGLGSSGSKKFYVRNAANCDPYPDAPDCGTCVLTLHKNPDRQNIGVGFKPGTNDDGRFQFQGSTATPADIPQEDATCTGQNAIPLVIVFSAPPEEGSSQTTIVIESNDPDEPVIEIPVIATAVNAPVAIANFQAFDPSRPTAPVTDGNQIAPLDNVYLDGRAKGTVDSSHDPRDPSDTTLISNYKWEIIDAPPDVNPDDFNGQGQGTGQYHFYVPLAGYYRVRLTVFNIEGLASMETEQSIVEFNAIPQERVHIQLVWDHPSNDQDLHLVHTVADDRLCAEPYDCYFSNKLPVWFPGTTGGQGPNPSLDVDDTNGNGPENINIDDPAPGSYRVYVHYFGDAGAGGVSATRATIRVWLNGVAVAEYKRTLAAAGAVWAVGDVIWNANGTGIFQPYPSDNGADPGAVATIQGDCWSPWAFP